MQPDRFRWSLHCFIVHRWKKEVIYYAFYGWSRCACGWWYAPGIGIERGLPGAAEDEEAVA